MTKEPPFGSAFPEDMFTSCREELFIISALIEHAGDCGNTNFRNADEAYAVIQEARVRVRSLLEKCGAAAAFLDKSSPPEAQAA